MTSAEINQTEDPSSISPEIYPILIVDDDTLILEALSSILQYEHYHVLTATNGEKAIEILKHNQVAIVLCDQSMPGGISGVEVLSQAISIQPDSIRIMLTGSSDLNAAIQAINLGQISHYILKPWDNVSFCQTIQTSMERYNLTRENQRLHELIKTQHKALMESHQLLRKELQIGAHIQEVLLVGKVPTDIPGVEIKATTIPSKDVDGDFFDFYRPAPAILDVVIGDVMGKGVPAALVGTAVKTQLIRFALPYIHAETFSKDTYWEDDMLSIAEVLTNVHRETNQQLIELEYFVTLFYGRFNLNKRTFNFVDCGSPKPLHYKAAENKIVQLSGDGFPLGVMEDPHYYSFEIPFEEQDLFVFYSDGVTETRSPDNELFGVQRLEKLLAQNAHGEVDDILDIIKKSILDFANQEKFEDDLTLIIMKVTNYNLPKLTQLKTGKFISHQSQLQAVREFVHALSLQAPGDQDRLFIQLQLAINEAFCNIVEHGYKNQPTGEIVIRGELENEGILFEILDQGEIFHPSAAFQPSFSGDKDDGFGWYLIRKISDQVTYIPKESLKGWNHLRIFKRYFKKEVEMEISSHIEGHILVITPEGENLDAKEAPAFKQKVTDLINHHAIYHVIFDLNRLQFIDSSGLGSLLSVLRVLHLHNGELKLTRMNKAIRTMFELVCMHKIFEIYNGTEEAVKSFK